MASLRVRLKKLIFKGALPQKDYDRINIALSKQDAIEPVKYTYFCITKYKCPMCNAKINIKNKYCNECGQKIKWED